LASLDLTSASLDLTSLAALLISALLLMLLWARRRTGRSTSKTAEDEDLDTVHDWPPQAVRVLTLSERKAYDLLRKALPNRLVLAQVPLARFITVPTKNSYGDWLNRAGRLSVDLLVCDQSSRVIAAIDIRTAEDSSRTRKRHTRMGEVLRKAGVVVHEWKAEALPSVADIRSAFSPPQAVGSPAMAVEGLTPSPMKLLGSNHMLPVPEAIEMLAAGDEAAANGLLLDPVSSAYFDDLDAFGTQAPTQR
jgi:hypothetical protein